MQRGQAGGTATCAALWWTGRGCPYPQQCGQQVCATEVSNKAPRRNRLVWKRSARWQVRLLLRVGTPAPRGLCF